MGQSSRRQQSGSRLILTQIGSYRVAFPTVLVGEIVLFERSRLLSLPMYPQQCMGIVHHRGTLMPLYSLRADPVIRKPLSETLTAICLGDAAGEQAGIGIEIDRLFGQVSQQEVDKHMPVMETDIGSLPNSSLATHGNSASISSLNPASIRTDGDRDNQSSSPLHIFSLDNLSDQLWSPWRTIVSPPT